LLGLQSITRVHSEQTSLRLSAFKACSVACCCRDFCKFALNPTLQEICSGTACLCVRVFSKPDPWACPALLSRLQQHPAHQRFLEKCIVQSKQPSAASSSTYSSRRVLLDVNLTRYAVRRRQEVCFCTHYWQTNRSAVYVKYVLAM